jgi:hypothetical protein
MKKDTVTLKSVDIMYKNFGVRSNYLIKFETSLDFEAGNFYGGEIRVTFPNTY